MPLADLPSDALPLTRAGLDAHWLPFSGNRHFKRSPRIISGAQGCYYFDAHGRKVYDGLSGLWTCGLGHGRAEIVRAVSEQVARLDYSPAFQFAHPLGFRLAERIAALMPPGLDRIFFVGSGSEAADTSLKMARAYWRLSGRPTKTRFIGRAKGYHGVNFGGISVGGIGGNKKLYGNGIEADHLAHTMLARNAFSKGQPAHGAELADELLELIALHDASNIAAVIVEPFAGSAGVIVPPVGYLQRLRNICDEHDILLIFDEVITGFGRTGAWTGSDTFGVKPHIINFAKQVTNGAIPMGGLAVARDIHDAFMAAGGADYAIEFPHGYTYSAHPVACAAALATMDALEHDDALARVNALAPLFEEKVHGLCGARHVKDIRNWGLAAGITLESWPGEPARRPFEVAMRLWNTGFYVRCGGDTLQLAPPFVTTPQEIDSVVDAIGEALLQQP